jgi:hypothetical protein
MDNADIVPANLSGEGQVEQHHHYTPSSAQLKDQWL